MKLLEALERAGVLCALDVELARALARVSGEADGQVLLGAALASSQVQAGHVCLDLAAWAERALEQEGQPLSFALPALSSWRRALERSPLVSTTGCTDQARPLVLDARGRLYLARYYDHEQALARRVIELARGTLPAELPGQDALLDRLFPRGPGEQDDLQRRAVEAARSRKLSLIVGGPGTGKTSTVVKLLALLVSDALARELPAPRILLAAPTGKAAQRLGEAIEKARTKLPIEDAIKQAIPHEALTVHRALGSLQGSATRFRHHAGHPLACDVLLLDEASMVDLALMRRLLDALPDHARVILLGDPDQLVSVEAGGVLGDLCSAAEQPTSPLAACLSRLTRSYRYPEHSGIAALARAVHAQDLEGALDVLRSGAADVRFAAPTPESGLGRSLEAETRAGYAGLAKADLQARLDALDQFRVLCAHRRGRGGVEQLNPALARSVSGRAHSQRENYPGRPILVTQNDYVTRLFNGDVGVLHAAARNTLSAHFRTGPDEVRSVALARLPTHESVYAMTVHKSQGSEFDQVAIVLPERPSPVVSRELLYTAITRAKLGVSLYASEAALRVAITQRTQRASGLRDRLSA